MAMRTIRTQLRKHGAQVLSVPQFRALAFVNRNKGASLSDVADHIGLALPSMSTLVDGLVERNYVTRRTHQDDRRRMTLMLTESGEKTLKRAREGTQVYLTEMLSQLSEVERASIIRSMQILRAVFAREDN